MDKALTNHTLSSGEINYITKYYGASDLAKTLKRVQKSSTK